MASEKELLPKPDDETNIDKGTVTSPILEQNKDYTKPIGKKDSGNERWCTISVVILTVSTLVELIILVVVTVMWRDARVAAIAQKEPRVCLPSSHIDNYETVCSGGIQISGNYCCGEASLLVDVLIKQSSKMKFEDSAAARMLTHRCDTEVQDDSIVAMMSGLSMPRIRQQGEGTVVFWNEWSPRNILKGVTYRNGAIFVNNTGHYFVYSQIKVSKPQKMTTTSTLEMDIDRPYFSHYVYRHTSGSNREILLESSNSDCDISSNDDAVTSSFGSVFKLEAGETVYVETSHPQNLVDCGHSNFFGLYSV